MTSSLRPSRASRFGSLRARRSHHGGEASWSRTAPSADDTDVGSGGIDGASRHSHGLTGAAKRGPSAARSCRSRRGRRPTARPATRRPRAAQPNARRCGRGLVRTTPTRSPDHLRRRRRRDDGPGRVLFRRRGCGRRRRGGGAGPCSRRGGRRDRRRGVRCRRSGDRNHGTRPSSAGRAVGERGHDSTVVTPTSPVGSRHAQPTSRSTTRRGGESSVNTVYG